MTEQSGDRYGGANNISTELLTRMIAVTMVTLAFSMGVRQAMAVIEKAGQIVPDSLFAVAKAMEARIAPAVPMGDGANEVTFQDATRYLFAISETIPLMREADLTLQGLGIHLYGVNGPLVDEVEEALRG